MKDFIIVSSFSDNTNNVFSESIFKLERTLTASFVLISEILKSSIAITSESLALRVNDPNKAFLLIFFGISFEKFLLFLGQKASTAVALKKLSPYQIIIKPVFSEKTMAVGEQLNKYVFKIHADANKNDVKQAIKTIYDVDVAKVNMQNVPYKGRFNRKLVRRSYKKATVSLKEWQQINLVN